MNDLLKKLKSPTSDYRPHPFWSWNDRLEEDELRRQIREMAKTGQGGFFMHARSGLETPYMGKEWMDLVRACVDEAEKCGLHAWCYDELGWPSGSAGGAVTAMGDDYCVRWLRLRPYEGKCEGDVIGFYGVREDNSYRHLGESEDSSALATEDERVMYATSFCDDSYFDILNPDVVKAFIDHTYEGYRREMGDALRDGRLHGYFTDEPQYALCRNPWSKVIPEQFERENGFSIIPHIPALFLGRDGFEELRFRFWRLVNRLFTESFAGQIYDWCEKNGTRLTGHAMMEDNLLCQIHCTAGCMPMYEYMHVPGIDWLGRNPATDRETGKPVNPTVPLQVGSVAAQLGKRHVITETYAMSGWDISFAEMKYLVEWQFLYGVNLVCQHLDAYSLRGHRKGDYPPSMFYHSSWWDEYSAYTDAVSRTGMLLSDSVDAPETLLLHPMHSIWLKYTNDDMNAEGEFDNRFMGTVMRLTMAHVPFHLGDETIIARHGKVKDGVFTVGERDYKTVLIPEIWGLDRTTYQLLLAFAEEGGRVVLLGCEPEFIDGVRCPDEIKKLTDKCHRVSFYEKFTAVENLLRFADTHDLHRVPIEGIAGEDGDVRVSVRHLGEGHVYFFLNTDKQNSHRVTVTLPEEDAVKLDVHTMKCEKVKSRQDDGCLKAELEFAPMESMILLCGYDIPAEAAPAETAPLPLDASTSNWTVGEESDVNCFLLEYCSVSRGEGWSGRDHTMRLDSMMKRDEYGDGEPQVKYTFTVDGTADLSAMTDMRFVTEVRLPARVTVNGEDAPLVEGEWWLDHSFSVFDLTGKIRHGENEVILTGFCTGEEKDGKIRYLPNSDFSFGYLTGRFGVFADGCYTSVDKNAVVCDDGFTLGNMPREINGGVITTEGFPFFRGKMYLSRNITVKNADAPRHVDLSGMRAACARVYVNGEAGGLIAFGKLTEDITSRLREGENEIKLELYVGNRNLLGPHHMPEAGMTSPGPVDFTPVGNSENWKERYAFVRYGV